MFLNHFAPYPTFSLHLHKMNEEEMLNLVDKNEKQIRGLIEGLKRQVSIYMKAFEFPNEHYSESENNEEFKKHADNFANESF